jgi:DNA-binding NarL/FixJ family response regulator
METISVLIADDYPEARAGIRALLTSAPDIRIIGEAADGAEILALVEKLHPRILLLDLRMPGPGRVEIEGWVRAHCPETITLVLTAHDRDAYLAEMKEAGAAGFMSKAASSDQLIAAIRCAANGETLFTLEQVQRVRRWREEVGERWEKLSEDQRQVMVLLMAGMGNKTIAKRLMVSTFTVEYRLTQIFEKLGVKSRLAAVNWVQTNIPEEWLTPIYASLPPQGG